MQNSKHIKIFRPSCCKIHFYFVYLYLDLIQNEYKQFN
jgi:hypothetical protein